MHIFFSPKGTGNVLLDFSHPQIPFRISVNYHFISEQKSHFFFWHTANDWGRRLHHPVSAKMKIYNSNKGGCRCLVLGFPTYCTSNIGRCGNKAMSGSKYIDGTVYMVPSPGLKHQLVSSNFHTEFGLYFRGKAVQSVCSADGVLCSEVFPLHPHLDGGTRDSYACGSCSR
ncbi:hypothetical protein SAMN05192569_1003179 [Parageobacillus thermantarcticus]|uniref:Uncharacterized protein n=1 Tax=Parageobacillus thermantarcticus TaxID=186116 RepID=A0A1I0SRA9_9BACL|nr:hypothetical protein SAMN05192569_1003179 [Parageobacillus thermantarcticus]